MCPPQPGPTSQLHIMLSHNHFYYQHHAIIARQLFTSAIVGSMATGSTQLVVKAQVDSVLDFKLEDSRRLRRTLVANHNAKGLVDEFAARDTLQSIATKRTDNPLEDTDLRTIDLVPTFGPNLRALVTSTMGKVKIEYTISVPLRLNLHAGDAEAIIASATSDYDAAATGSGSGKSFATALAESGLPLSLAVLNVTASHDPGFEVKQKESTANPILTIEVRLISYNSA